MAVTFEGTSIFSFERINESGVFLFPSTLMSEISMYLIGANFFIVSIAPNRLIESANAFILSNCFKAASLPK